MIDPKAIAQKAADYTAAWSSGSAQAVAAHYAEDGVIIINNGDPWNGRAKVQEMAEGFYTDVPDLNLKCDSIRSSGTHAVFAWSFTGHDADTKNPLHILGWEEWELGEDLKVKSSRGWFDADEYARQVAG
jgi:uncharacterized protein (TIGR02246 family)